MENSKHQMETESQTPPKSCITRMLEIYAVFATPIILIVLYTVWSVNQCEVQKPPQQILNFGYFNSQQALPPQMPNQEFANQEFANAEEAEPKFQKYSYIQSDYQSESFNSVQAEPLQQEPLPEALALSPAYSESDEEYFTVDYQLHKDPNSERDRESTDNAKEEVINSPLNLDDAGIVQREVGSGQNGDLEEGIDLSIDSLEINFEPIQLNERMLGRKKRSVSQMNVRKATARKNAEKIHRTSRHAKMQMASGAIASG